MIVSETFLSHGLESLVTFNPICIRPETQLDELLERLYSTGFHHWPVVDLDKKLIGIISDQDIVRAASEREAASETFQMPRESLRLSVSDFMQKRVVTIDSQEKGFTALSRFLQHGFHSLPVIKEERILGMITTSDFIREFSLSVHPAKEVPVTEVYDKTPVLFDSEATLDDMRVELLCERAKYCIVTQGDCALGVLSDRDLRRYKCREIAQTLFSQTQTKATRAIDMICSTHHVPNCATLGSVAQWMQEEQATVVMVRGRDALETGVISQEHILAYLAEYEANLN